MAVSATPVTGAHTVWANKDVRVYDLEFSGNYPNDGEVVNADDVGLKTIEQVFAPGVVPNASDLATGHPIAVVIADDGSSASLVFYDAATAGGPLDEKPAEGHINEGPVRVTFIGH